VNEFLYGPGNFQLHPLCRSIAGIYIDFDPGKAHLRKKSDWEVNAAHAPGNG
jgi:hypothetical protein